MNWVRSFLFLAIAHSSFADTPKEVAEDAMRAWVSHDAPVLVSLSHPELILRMRTARIIQFYLEYHPDKRMIPESGSDSQVVKLLCEALEEIVPPRNGDFIYKDRYIDTKEMGDLAIVTFERIVTSAVDSNRELISHPVFVLKRKDSKWLFLWSSAVNIHVDLEWDPRP